ncbi:MAG: hypothetical protein MZV63_24605 [Marinilabiliales bacterium]|nr:hypothetical protein [Marinilabiliales bacterium]
MTTDADCVVGRGWVSAMAWLSCSDMGRIWLLGRGLPAWRRRLCSRVSECWSSRRYRLSVEAAVLSGHPVMCNGANMGFQEGYLHASLGECRD